MFFTCEYLRQPSRPPSPLCSRQITLPLVWTLKPWICWWQHELGSPLVVGTFHCLSSLIKLVIPWASVIPRLFAALALSKAASCFMLALVSPLTIWWIPACLWGQLTHRLLWEACPGNPDHSFVCVHWVCVQTSISAALLLNRHVCICLSKKPRSFQRTGTGINLMHGVGDDGDENQH